MTRKKKEQTNKVETYRIDAMFAPEVFCPSNAIEDSFWARNFGTVVRFRTNDGKLCEPTFQSTTNNADGKYEEKFDDFCRRHFDCSFSSIRSIWISRLDRLDNYWHWITLKLIDEN